MSAGASVEAVLFDLFGTLVPTDPPGSWDDQIRRMAEPVGVPPVVLGRAFSAHGDDRMTGALDIADNVRVACDAAGVTPTEEQLAAAVAAREAVLRRWLVPRPATLPALDALRAAGVPLALVSDASTDTVAMWPQTVLPPYFAATVFSAAMRTRKPDPRMYTTACDALGVDPAACAYVGDGNSRELTGAAALGLRAILIDAELPAYEGPEYEGRTWTGERVHALTEVPPLLGL